MYKKPQNSDALAAYLAQGGTITRGPTMKADAIPLSRLRREADEAAARGEKKIPVGRAQRAEAKRERRELEAESRFERQMESAMEMAANGRRCVGFDVHGNAVGYED